MNLNGCKIHITGFGKCEGLNMPVQQRTVTVCSSSFTSAASSHRRRMAVWMFLMLLLSGNIHPIAGPELHSFNLDKANCALSNLMCVVCWNNSNMIHFDGYNVFRTDRVNKGGGVVNYTKTSLNSSAIESITKPKNCLQLRCISQMMWISQLWDSIVRLQPCTKLPLYSQTFCLNSQKRSSFYLET